MALRDIWYQAYDSKLEAPYEDTKSVYTLNTWTDEQKDKAREYFREGYWVYFGSTCIGHTLAKIVENKGIEWTYEKYGDKIQIAKGYYGWVVRVN